VRPQGFGTVAGAPWALLGGALAAVVAASHALGPLVVGALGAAGAAARLAPRRPAPGSRWRAGLAALPIALFLAATGPVLGGLLGGLLTTLGALVAVAGSVASAPRRDAGRGRALVVEAGLAGGVVAYLAAAAGVVEDVHQLLPIATLASVVWLAGVQLGRGADGPDRVGRRLVAGAALLLVAVSPLAATPLDGRLAAALAGAGLWCWTLAAASLDLLHPVGPATVEREPLTAAHVRLVVVGVLVGPAVVALAAWRAPATDPVPLVVAGGALAAVAVVHLLQLVRDHARRAWQARHDALTSLPGELLFEDRLERAMARGRRTGTGFTVAFLDLDGFKRVNDRDGHAAGDHALRVVAERLRGAVREQDTVARRSGDEFLLLLEGVDRRADAERVARKLLDTLRPPVGPVGRQHRLGASIGLARWPADGDDPDTLTRAADAAMYEAKAQGRGAVRWYTAATSDRSRLRLTLAAQLEAAIEEGQQLELAFHPRVDLRDGRVVELVALVRWRHPRLGTLRPPSFLPVAEDTGSARELDAFVLELAVRTLRRWEDDGLLRDLPVLVHLSAASLRHDDLEPGVVAVLRRTGLAPSRLGLAVPGDALVRAEQRGARSTADLAELGVRTTVVGFGRGDVGLDRLRDAAVASVELAEALVADLGPGRLPPLVAATLAAAEALGVRTTAGGVTSRTQADRLRAAGCVTARGVGLAPALPSATLGRRLRSLPRRADGALLARDLAVPVLRRLEGPES
jgi:diguanylate cyclase (GGDEF)-like protein